MLKQYQRTWAEVSLDAIEANINTAKAKLAPATKLMCVIKADGYGHGALALARFLADQCDYFAVAVLEEALTLRAAGVTMPILLLGYTSPSQYEAVVQADLAQTIYSMETAELLSQAAQRAGTQASIHVAVDTGMGRIGFADCDASIEQIVNIAGLQGIALEGLYTHFARADEADLSSAIEQYTRFETFAAKLRSAGVTIPIQHVCNSAATIQFDASGTRQPGGLADMVRFGISLYGLYPSDAVNRTEFPLRPAMQWKTHVVHMKTVPAGTGISYGHTFVTQRETRVATLPIGYADGYPRALSNRGHVLIRGAFAPVIGRVCMDQCMVDVTDIPNVAMEDEVILIGQSGGKRITMEEIGAMSESFHYETACRVGQRVPRVYTYQGKVVGNHLNFITMREYLSYAEGKNGSSEHNA